MKKMKQKTLNYLFEESIIIKTKQMKMMNYLKNNKKYILYIC
jgi:hypothetical protein